ncbi:MAG: Sfum_1244 family protein [Desulfopila sp.]
MTIASPHLPLINDIQQNCDISDARDHGIYSMCTMVLKLRNLYKWEKGVEPWAEPEAADLLDWIDAKEKYWQTIAARDYRSLTLAGKRVAPLDLSTVNTLLPETLFYGAGFGRSLKTVFFLAEQKERFTVAGCPVVVLDTELAREMASPFAMVQEGLIVIRSQSLRYFFWDQIQEVRSSCRISLKEALAPYGGVTSEGELHLERLRQSLDTIVRQERDLFIYHEVGEMLEGALPTEILQEIIGRFPGSVLEFVSRAVKDLLADTHPQGLLAFTVREKRHTTLSFYLAFLDGLRAKLFGEIHTGYRAYLADRDWRHIEGARSDCRRRLQEIAIRIGEIAGRIDEASDEEIQQAFASEVVVPLGLELPPRP